MPSSLDPTLGIRDATLMFFYFIIIFSTSYEIIFSKLERWFIFKDVQKLKLTNTFFDDTWAWLVLYFLG